VIGSTPIHHDRKVPSALSAAKQLKALHQMRKPMLKTCIQNSAVPSMKKDMAPT